MTGDQLAALIARAMPTLATAQEELRALDAALGDGDLGITVSKGAAAVQTAVEALPDGSAPAAVLRAAGQAFASANPSTMAALTGGALLAAAKEVGDATDVDRALALRLCQAAAGRIADRGKAVRGDKTVLDALLPSIEALAASTESASTAALTAAVEAAEAGVRDTAGKISQRGRAAWIGERGAGTPDPGATAYVRLLQALRDAWAA